MKSFSYYLVIGVLRLKGMKKKFQQSPIDYKNLRNDDVSFPKGSFFKNNATKFKVLKSTVVELSNSKSDKLLIFVHGGAFVFGPNQHHWDTMKSLFEKTNFSIWMCDYPKAPESSIKEITQNIDAIIDIAYEKYDKQNIVLIGDSVGGNLILTHIQRQISNNKNLPQKIILISPVMDASMSNPEIERVDKIDPMLSLNGVLSAKQMAAKDISLSDPIISPLNGDFNGFPNVELYIGENDITFPDQLIFHQKLTQASVPNELVIGKGMPHIWPLLPIMKESKQALRQIIDGLK